MHKIKLLTGAAAIIAAGIFTTTANASDKQVAAAGHGGSHNAKPAKSTKSHSAPHWEYGGNTGPSHWGDLSPAFKACSIGLQQSPIDLHGYVGAQLNNITVSYKATPFEVVNNGHTIQVNVLPGSSIMLEGVQYNLLQFHFHHPSEHLLDGKPFEMEAHFVHISDAGVLAVLGVFIKPGQTNALMAPIWANMPAKPGKKSSSAKISPQDLLPKNRSYLRYYGSLTTPPCSEKVIWSVFNEPVEASESQARKFSALFPMNARPAQNLNRRFLLGSR